MEPIKIAIDSTMIELHDGRNDAGEPILEIIETAPWPGIVARVQIDLTRQHVIEWMRAMSLFLNEHPPEPTAETVTVLAAALDPEQRPDQYLNWQLVDGKFYCPFCKDKAFETIEVGPQQTCNGCGEAAEWIYEHRGPAQRLALSFASDPLPAEFVCRECGARAAVVDGAAPAGWARGHNFQLCPACVDDEATEHTEGGTRGQG